MHGGGVELMARNNAKTTPRARVSLAKDKPDESDRRLADTMTLVRFADFVPPGAPDVFRAAVKNLDELTIASLNHARQFKGRWYAEPNFQAAMKAQETTMRLFRMLGPEAASGQDGHEPTPETIAEARRVLKLRGWTEPGGKDE